MDIEKLARSFLKEARSYKPGKPVEVVQREKGTKAPFIKLASNENSRSPHESIIRAVGEELRERGNRYPESGCYHLVRELARHWRVVPEEVFVGNGSNEIIDLLVRAFVDRGENCVFPTPSFVVYGMVCTIAGVEGRAVRNRENYYVDLDAILSRVDSKTKIVFLCNPNNPTGTYFTSSQMEEFLASLPDDVLVVVDEAYYEYVRAADYPNTLSLRSRREGMVVLRTFSKIYALAGLRVGYAIADHRLIDILHKVRQPFNVNRLAQIAAIAALRHSEEIVRNADEIVGERERVRDELIRMGCDVPPSQTNFLYVVPPPFEGDLCERLLDHGVIVRNMQAFGGDGNTFRVTLGTSVENERFLSALEEVLNI